ncbi:MAG: GNAT family N-acetyltransferase [Marmoricola sp.]
MLAPTYPLRTERLLLRPFAPGDLDDVHAYQSLPEVCRYIPYEPRTREQVAERIGPDRARERIDEPGQALMLAVQLPDGPVIGDVMLAWASAEHQTAEVGYVFHPDHAGRGYATEAGRELLRLAFDELGVRRVTARTDAANTASHRVLRRIGMRPEAYLLENEWFKGAWSDEIDFAILRREWSRS